MKKEWGIKDVLIALLGEGLLFGALILSVAIKDSESLVRRYPIEIRNILMGILYISFVIFGLLIICKGLLKINFRDCRILPIKIKTIWIILAFIMPLLVSGILLCFPGEWLNIEFSTANMITTLSLTLVFFGIAAPIVEEMIFRGMMLTVFEKKWNREIAIFLSSLLFGIGHIIGQKMELRDFFIMSLSAGLIGATLSLVTFITESIWSSVVIHMVWNIIIMGQIISIGGVRPLYSRYNYTFNSDSFLLTGGAFGIEASLPSIVINIIFLTIVWKLWKRR
ncbi:CPBP family intramembrane glutamic endopeptidase [Fusobacterium sp.]|uniref:CPBP family intramembrane glutamic endopeptidase n=1 Tax=Fusobacterium sp. TaxID=68766 RepID=UPI002903A0D3|nr:CPBP family intramembrane glutamic endopeptidase [Fusobacterium sp.]MDU1912615.1 CPBP family intramembrane glutamic endopeptidase [Fusobacterium sp.]